MAEDLSFFDKLIEVIISTIEKRDPVTSGHSVRVAIYAVKLAKAINKVNYGKYKNTFFSDGEMKELYYAAILHDLGKIGISENILTKKNKLSSINMELIRYRFSYIKSNLTLKKVEGTINFKEDEVLNNIDEYYKFLDNINLKQHIEREEIDSIKKIYNKEFLDPVGEKKHLITENELENIIVLRGNLSKKERKIINMHPVYTYEILKTIPWIESLKRIPKIALQHHEKLDGSGYPNRLKESSILIPARIITIADMYEALTSIDRPYKRSFSADKALEIIKEEVSLGKLDKDLFDIFLNEEIYNVPVRHHPL